MTPPNSRERKVLTALRLSGWEFKGSLRAGKITFASLLQKGWITYLPITNSGLERVAITDVGRKALDVPIQMKKQTKQRLTMLKPKVKTVDMHFGNPLKIR